MDVEPICWELSLIFLHLIHWVRSSQLSPDLTGQSSQPACSGDPLSHLPGAGIKSWAPFPPGFFYVDLEIWTLVLTLRGQTLYRLSPDSSFINSSGGRRIPKQGDREIDTHLPSKLLGISSELCSFSFPGDCMSHPNSSQPQPYPISTTEKMQHAPQSFTSRQPTTCQTTNRKAGTRDWRHRSLMASTAKLVFPGRAKGSQVLSLLRICEII